MSDENRNPIGSQPILILGEGAERTKGRDAQAMNIEAARAIAEAVKSTLGPNGMDKMMVGGSDNIQITNDGATILDDMDIEHPAAKMIVEVAESQENKVGDGTTTATVIAGELLSQAEKLIDSGLHPTSIVEGYTSAQKKAVDILENQAFEADEDTLISVAESSMTGKTGGISKNLAPSVVDAVKQIKTEKEANPEDVHIEARPGRNVTATYLIQGVVADAKPVHDNMDDTAHNASIAVLDFALQQPETELDAEYKVNTAQDFGDILEGETGVLEGYADDLKDAGVDVVFTTEDIDDRVAAYLADRGIIAFEDIDSDNAEAIAETTNASFAGRIEDVEDSVGHADRVELAGFADDDIVIVEGGVDSNAVTLFVRGGTEHFIDELKRSIRDGVNAVAAAVNSGVVPGGGATEVTVAEELRDYAEGIEGREQLAVEVFADAVESIPKSLARNSGLDPIDALADARAMDGAGIITIDEETDVSDPIDAGVLDPLSVKKGAVQSASEVSSMILRIDDVIAGG